MPRRDSIHEFVQNGCTTQNNQNQNSKNTVNCSGTGNFWIIPERYQIIKYVTLLGETKFKEAGGLPFGKFFWRKNIEIIDSRDNILNLPKVTDYKTQNGVSIVADVSVQYSIRDVSIYIQSQLNLKEKITENVKSILQAYFRNKDAESLNRTDINIDTIGRDKFQNIENQYGIRFTTFNCTSLKFPEIDDDKTKRVENKLKYENEKENLSFEKNLMALQREIELYKSETDNQIRTQRIENIKNSISGFPQNQQAQLLQKIYEIEALKNSTTNITYISGSENLGNNISGRRR